jgi:hypothetical protein
MWLQVEHDGVDGILDFVGDSAGDAAAGREAAGHLDFVADTAHRLGVAQNEESADGIIFFLNEIQRNLDVPAGRGDELALRQRTLALESVEHENSQRRVAEENLLRSFPQQFGARPSEEALDRRADQNHAGVASEEHQSILQRGHELINVVL